MRTSGRGTKKAAIEEIVMNEFVKTRCDELVDEIEHSLIWAGREHGDEQRKLMVISLLAALAREEGLGSDDFVELAICLKRGRLNLETVHDVWHGGQGR
jgi:hypothetical protein